MQKKKNFVKKELNKKQTIKMASEKAYLSYGVVTGVVLSFNFVLLKLPYGVVEVLVLPVYLTDLFFLIEFLFFMFFFLLYF